MFYFGVVWMAMSGGKTVKFLKKIFRNFLTFEILDFSTVKNPNNALAATAGDWASILLHYKIHTELTGQVYRNIYVRPGVIMTLICMACGFHVLGIIIGKNVVLQESIESSLNTFLPHSLCFSLSRASLSIFCPHMCLFLFFLYPGFSSFFRLSGCAWCEILPEHQKKPDY